MIKFNSVTLDAEMVLGDTGTFSITPKLDGETYLTTGDTVYFTVRERKGEQNTKIYKAITEFTDGTATIPIEPSDTTLLDPGTYIYDIVVNRSDGTVDTLTPNGQAYFALKKGVK
jgi:hypothetical protein